MSETRPMTRDELEREFAVLRRRYANALAEYARKEAQGVWVPRSALVEIARGKMPEDHGRLDITVVRLSGIARDLLAARSTEKGSRESIADRLKRKGYAEVPAGLRTRRRV